MKRNSGFVLKRAILLAKWEAKLKFEKFPSKKQLILIEEDFERVATPLIQDWLEKILEEGIKVYKKHNVKLLSASISVIDKKGQKGQELMISHNNKNAQRSTP